MLNRIFFPSIFIAFFLSFLNLTPFFDLFLQYQVQIVTATLRIGLSFLLCFFFLGCSVESTFLVKNKSLIKAFVVGFGFFILSLFVIEFLFLFREIFNSIKSFFILLDTSQLTFKDLLLNSMKTSYHEAELVMLEESIKNLSMGPSYPGRAVFNKLLHLMEDLFLWTKIFFK